MPGSAFAYDGLVTGNWAPILLDGFQVGSQFGADVATDGDLLLVGAPRANTLVGTAHGAAYAFERVPGVRDFGGARLLLSTDTGPNTRFGQTVGLSGNIAVVGAPFLSRPAYLFERQGFEHWGADSNGDGASDPTRALSGNPPQGNDRIGESVAITASGVLIGASLFDSTVGDTGGVLAFGLLTPIIGDNTTIANNVQLGTGVVIGDNAVVQYGSSIGDYSQIGDGTSLGVRARIGDGAVVGADSDIGYYVWVGDNATIGDNTTIQPRSRVYDGAVLGDGVSLGYYATIGSGATAGAGTAVGTGAFIWTNSEIGANSQVAAYAGVYNDVQVGARADIGVGARVLPLAEIGSDVVVGRRAVIGRFARIGDGVQIGQNVRILAGAEIPDGTVIPDGAVVAPANASDVAGNWTVQTALGPDACGAAPSQRADAFFISQSGNNLRVRVAGFSRTLYGVVSESGRVLWNGYLRRNGTWIQSSWIGQFDGVALSGSVSGNWPDGCAVTGTFTGMR